MFGFNGYALTPGQHDEFFTQEGQITWGRWDQQKVSQALIDDAAVDSGNDTTTTLRPGLALGKLSTGELTHWNPFADGSTASEGSRDFVGFFMENISMSWMGSTKERLIYCLVGGNIKADSIIVPGQSSAGISGTDYEILLREAAAPNFLFDDDLNRITAKKLRATMTDDEIDDDQIVLTVEDHNTHVFLYDADATTTVILPSPVPGLKYIISTYDQTVMFAGPSGGEFLLDRDGTAGDGDTITVDNNETITIYGVATASDAFAYITDPTAT